MKPKITIVLIIFLTCLSVQDCRAQFFKKLAKKVEKTVEETVTKKVDEKAEKTTEKAMDSLFDTRPKQHTKDRNVSHTENTSTVKGATTKFTSYSKFDFISGEQLLAFEDFSQDEIGDLPAKWNSTNSAEIVTIEGITGKWMKIVEGEGAYVPDFITDFPDNFTLEFDVIFDFDIGAYCLYRNLGIIFSDIANPHYDLTVERPGENGFFFNISGGISYNGNLEYEKYTSDSQLNTKADKENRFLKKDNLGRGKVHHVSIWRQKQRLRVYFNEEKVFDIPRALEPKVQVNAVRFFSKISEPNTYYFLGNIRYAVGKPDLRSKLVTEGKLVTYGITFAINSASIKPASYGTLKSIANILNQHPELHIAIIGHTDGDGIETANQKLSEQRANSVKNLLVEEFGINANRLIAEGKGESELLDRGNSPESKAKNRRVEFVKQ